MDKTYFVSHSAIRLCIYLRVNQNFPETVDMLQKCVWFSCVNVFFHVRYRSHCSRSCDALV